MSGWEGTKAMEDGERTPGAHILTNETGDGVCEVAQRYTT